MLSSISSNLLPQLIGCKTAHDIWATVEQIFNSQSAEKIMFYKRQSQNLKKDNLCMREYLTKIKTLCDLLDAAGHRVFDTEQILTILNGLDREYKWLQWYHQRKNTWHAICVGTGPSRSGNYQWISIFLPYGSLLRLWSLTELEHF